ncbi:hypothetical protein HOLleu_39513 [Holothuria leucospilota]|uniref:Ig-like domain-containing protein n=1 Tax=Holothuria leucospilota TaxID=206669 RepID=A0A9Q0YNF3_HOLLE|nr:hypothetical protein HOLleu_39513 [Holothuria leucospilota]
MLLFFSFSNAEMTITFEIRPTEYEVFEGTAVLLVYKLEANNSIRIIHNGIAIVRNSVLQGSPERYTLIPPTSNNAYILRLNQVERNDSGRYFSREGTAIFKQLDLKVYYSPKSDPSCTSSHDSSTYFFKDMLGEEFEFNCTVEDGNPVSEAVIYQKFEAKERHVLDINIIKGKNERGSLIRTLSFSSRFNSSFNTSSFTCDVRQKMPPSLKEHDYKKTCVYGPLTFLLNFDVLVSPRLVTIEEGEPVTLTCSTNVECAEKKWTTNVTEGVEMVVKESENKAHLTLSVPKGFPYDVIEAVCKSSFDNRNSSAKVHINIMRGSPKYFIAIIVLFSILLIGLLIFLLFMCHFKSVSEYRTFCRRREKTKPNNEEPELDVDLLEK